jgi:diguanylate cyclase (GGDEF)-like protein
MEWHYETEIISTIVLVIILLDSFRRFKSFKIHDKVFICCIGLGIISGLVDIFDSVMPSLTSNLGMLIFSRSMYYIFSTTPALMWFFYLSSIAYESERKKLMVWQTFGLAAFLSYVLVILFNISTHAIFYFDSDLTYHHGFLFNIIYYYCAFYTLMFFLILFMNLKKITNKKLIVYLVMMPLIIWAGLALEMSVPNWLMLGPSYMIAILLAYLFIQNQTTESIIDQLSLEAYTDKLTGLYNRAKIENQLNIALNSSKDCGLLLVDIDGLKKINDTLGHPEGDKAIRLVASELKNSLTCTQCIGRIGGDEFAAVITGVKKDELTEEIKNFLTKIDTLSVGSQPEYKIKLSCSIGVAFKDGQKCDINTIYRCSDVALYSVKRKSKDFFAFYQKEMEEDYLDPNIGKTKIK